MTRRTTSKSSGAVGANLPIEFPPPEVLTGGQPAPDPGVRRSPKPGFARELLGGLTADDLTLTEAEMAEVFLDHL